METGGGPDLESAGQASPSARQERDVTPDPYTLLLQYYGDLMARLGKLEARVSDLSARLDRLTDRDGYKGPLAEGVSGEPGAALTPVLEKLAELEDRLAQLGPAPRTDEQEAKDKELEQLRLQISALSAKLAQTEERLAEYRGPHELRRRRRRHRPWWRFWGRSRY